MKKNCQSYFFVVLTICTFLNTKAQDYFVRNYTVKDGLPASSLCGASLKSTGELWLVFFDGQVGRFDGKNYYPFQIPNEIDIGQAVNVFEDDMEGLWICSSNGLACYKGGRFIELSIPQRFKSQYFSVVMQDSRHNIWAGGMGCVIKFSYEKEVPKISRIFYFPDFNSIAENIIKDKAGNIDNLNWKTCN